MANWVGGAFVNRDKKGDPGDRPPVEVVPAEQQRAALKFVIDTSFSDEAYGLTPKLLERMSVDKWLDGGVHSSMSNEATWPIHDRILGVQASALTWLMNPTTLRRVYDNELRLPADEDTLTLPELLESINKAVWSELEQDCPEDRNDRQTDDFVAPSQSAARAHAAVARFGAGDLRRHGCLQADQQSRSDGTANPLEPDQDDAR